MRSSLAVSLSSRSCNEEVIPFKFRLKPELTEHFEKGESKFFKLGINDALKLRSNAHPKKKESQKLLTLLQQLGIREEHIPKTTKNIDDLLENEAEKNGGNDSSIDEPNIRDAAVELDEFEALFWVAPKNSTDEHVKDFKIQRKTNSTKEEVPSNGLKVKVTGGLLRQGTEVEQNNSPEDEEMKQNH